MTISAILNRTLRFINIRSGARGNSAFAQLAALNAVVDQLNNIFSYRSHDVVISPSALPGGDLRIAVVSSGAGECPHNCGSICESCDCHTTPCTGGSNEIAFTERAILVGTHTALGSYELSVVLPDAYTKKNPSAITKVSFFFEPFIDPSARVTITPTPAPNVYILNTFVGGAPSDSVLNKTGVALRIYFRPVVFP